VKSYKEERQKMQEARAARAAAKADGKKSGTSEDKQECSEGSSSRPSGRVRNKDRPALQIYRPGMLKKGSSDGDQSADKAED